MNWRSDSLTATDVLRALVRAVLVEDATTLKGWALHGYNPFERELAKLDIVPVGRGKSGSSELGSGLYNVVHEVVYKGRRAAARYSRRKEELESLLTFVSYRDKLDPKFRKHFPKVYTTFEFAIDNVPYYGAVVELLEPMPPGLEFDIDHMSLSKNLQRSRVAIVSKPSVVKALLPKHVTPDVGKELLAFFERELKPLLNKLIGQPLSVVDDKLVDLGDVKVRESNAPYMGFINFVFKALRGEVIPTGSESSRVTAAVAPKHPAKSVRDLYKFIQTLKTHGLQAEDLHTGNFMIRPGTHDFVVVDPGLFTKISNVTYEDF